MTSRPDSAVELDGVTKYYASHRGIEDLSLTIERGEVLGFLGPNGSGKTTTIRMLMGFLRPTRGRAYVLGVDVARQSVEVRRRVGYLPGDVALYGERTGSQLLDLSLRIRGLEHAPHAVKIEQALGAPMDRPVKKLSRGMRQKVALVLTMAHDPDVLILDEPTSGLDPLAQRSLLQVLDDAGHRGKVVLFSSHALSEAEQICDRVAILGDGRLLALERVDRLRERKFKEVTVVYDGAPPDLAGIEDVEIVWRHERSLTFRTRADINVVLATLAKSDLSDLSITEPSLEEVFLDYYRGRTN